MVLIFTNQTRSEMLKRLSIHLFAGRELCLAVLELRSHRLLVVAQLAAPAQQKLSTGLELELEPT